MKKEINKVIEFHSVFKQEFKTEPSVGDMDLAKKRYDLGKEELDEYLEAVEAGDIVEILDALVDQAYILFGTVIKHGLQDKFTRAFNLVHENNMTKLDENGDAILAPNGKIIKPDNFVPVDLSEVFNHSSYRFKTLEEFKESCAVDGRGDYICGSVYFV
jgi:predicted HAD superfamily Cof-like phosphohydrolase